MIDAVETLIRGDTLQCAGIDAQSLFFLPILARDVAAGRLTLIANDEPYPRNAAEMIARTLQLPASLIVGARASSRTES